MTGKSHNWSRMSLEELEGFYRGTISAEMISDDLDPTSKPPTYDWLTEKGYSGMAYTLREHHDLTLQEFFVDVVGVGSTGDDYEWGISHEPTIEAMNEYLQSRGDRRNLADTTIRSRKYKLAQFARKYEKHHGTADLLAHLDDPDSESDEFRRCMRVFDEFDDELSTTGSKLKYCDIVRQFYDHLVDYFGAEYNPIDRVPKQYDWKRSEPDNKTLDRLGMREIYQSTDAIEDRLLVLGLGAWGLRPNEVASAHVSQFITESGHLEISAKLSNETVSVYVSSDGADAEGASVGVNGEMIGSTDRFGCLRFSLDGRPRVEIKATTDRYTKTTLFEVDDDQLVEQESTIDPHIVFDERKNGPGSVSLLYGLDVLEARIEALEGDDWNGYLFPSKLSSSGHVTAETINNRFKSLAEGAGVTVDGEIPTAKMGRRFWYSVYSDASEAFIEQLQGIASDQGSSSAEIVHSNYLSEEDRRKSRRKPMQDALERVFGE